MIRPQSHSKEAPCSFPQSPDPASMGSSLGKQLGRREAGFQLFAALVKIRPLGKGWMC